jgi:hypothetical protein
VKRQLRLIYDELCLNFVIPTLYPPLQDLRIKRIERFMYQYSLCAEADYQDALVAELEG